MHSALYTGRLSHHRRRPVSHAFDYPLCYAWLDLAELDEVFRGRWLWSTRRPRARLASPRRLPGRSPRAARRGRARARRSRDRPATGGPHPAAHAAQDLRPLLQSRELLLLLRRRGPARRDRGRRDHEHAVEASATLTYCRPIAACAAAAACASGSARTSTSPPSCPWTSTTTGASRRPASSSPCTWRTGAKGRSSSMPRWHSGAARSRAGASPRARALPVRDPRGRAGDLLAGAAAVAEAHPLPRPPRPPLERRHSRRRRNERHDADRPRPPRAAPESAGHGTAAARWCWRASRRLECGRPRLRVHEGDTVQEFRGPAAGMVATIEVRDPSFFAELAYGGSVGAAESYMLGHWEHGRPHRAAASDAPQPQGSGRPRERPRAPVRAAAPRRTLAAPQHAGRQPAQHRRALRPRQRVLPAVPRRDADVLLRAVRAAGHDARRRPRLRSWRPSAASSRSARRPRARDRHRLGRLRHARRAASTAAA